jgi:hypothetical protein
MQKGSVGLTRFPHKGAVILSFNETQNLQLKNLDFTPIPTSKRYYRRHFQKEKFF